MRDTWTKRFSTITKLTCKQGSKLTAHLIRDLFLRAGFRTLTNSTCSKMAGNPNCREMESRLKDFFPPHHRVTLCITKEVPTQVVQQWKNSEKKQAAESSLTVVQRNRAREVCKQQIFKCLSQLCYRFSM